MASEQRVSTAQIWTWEPLNDVKSTGLRVLIRLSFDCYMLYQVLLMSAWMLLCLNMRRLATTLDGEPDKEEDLSDARPPAAAAEP